MSEMITRLREAIDLAERHAEKDLVFVQAATAEGVWDGWYGRNHDWSYLKVGEETIATVGGERHEADAELISRAVRWMKRRAGATLRRAAADRRILELHEPGSDNDTICQRCEETAYHCQTMLALADGYGVEP